MPSVFVRPSHRRSRPLALAMGLSVVLAACAGVLSPVASGPGAGSSADNQALPSLPAAIGGGAGACAGGGVTFCGPIKIGGGVTRDSDFVAGAFL